MGTPFIGEVKIISWGFAPKGWAFCNGQPLPINQNQALFSILGTTYGGNGQTTFALPNLQGKVPIHSGSSVILGQTGGEEAHTLSINELPTHLHVLQASSQNGNDVTPQANLLAAANNVYTAPSNLTSLSPQALTNSGGSQPHTNMQPYLTLNFIIALEGVFPSRNN